jgi:hypothetical protein
LARVDVLTSSIGSVHSFGSFGSLRSAAAAGFKGGASTGSRPARRPGVARRPRIAHLHYTTERFFVTIEIKSYEIGAVTAKS